MLECILRDEEASFDMILMDIQMPVMGGLEAVAEYRAIEEKLRKLSLCPKKKRSFICGMSADHHAAVSESAYQHGMDSFQQKPIKSLNDIYQHFIQFQARA